MIVSDKSKNHKIPWLDFIRFTAAFLVLAAHTRGFLFEKYSDLDSSSQHFGTFIFYSLTRFGTEAVILFFVLSGFLVGGPLIKRVRLGTFDSKSYIIDRLTRIYTPLFPTILLTICISLIISFHIDLAQILGNIFSLQGVFVETLNSNPPLWSLSYEIWFYCLGLAIVLVFNSKKINILKIAFLIFCIYVFTILKPAYLLCWLAGAFVHTYPSKKKSKTKLIILGCLTLLIMGLSQLTSDSISFEKYGFLNLINNDFILVIFAVFTAFFIRELILFQSNNTFSIILNWIGLKCAPFSFSLYLIHYPILFLIPYFGFIKMNTFNFTTLLVFLAVLVILMSVSYLFYICFEKQSDRIKIWLKNKLKFQSLS